LRPGWAGWPIHGRGSEVRPWKTHHDSTGVWQNGAWSIASRTSRKRRAASCGAFVSRTELLSDSDSPKLRNRGWGNPFPGGLARLAGETFG